MLIILSGVLQWYVLLNHTARNVSDEEHSSRYERRCVKGSTCVGYYAGDWGVVDQMYV